MVIYRLPNVHVGYLEDRRESMRDRRRVKRRAIYAANCDSNTRPALTDNPRVYGGRTRNSAPHRSAGPPSRPHSCRLPRSLSRGTRKRAVPRYTGVVYSSSPPSFISIGQQWRRETRFSSGRESLLHLRSQLRLILLASRLSTDRRLLLFTLSSPFLFFFLLISLPLAPRPSWKVKSQVG